MDASARRMPTRHPSDSSTEEPVAVRRRLGLDGSFVGVRLQRRDGHRSPVEEPTDAGHVHCEAFWDTNFATGSGYSTRVLSCGSDTEKIRRSSFPSNVSGAPRKIEPHKDVVTESSESCKRSGTGVTSEKSTSGNSGIEASHSSYSSDDDLKVLTSPFGGSSYSLFELDLACTRASQALNKEQKREDSIFSVITDSVTKISELTYRFYSVQTVTVCTLLANVENSELRKSCVLCKEFDARLDVVKTYVSEVSAEAEMDGSGKAQVIQLHSSETASDSTNPIVDSTSDEDRRTLSTPDHTYLVRRASNSVRKSRNVVVRQRKVMSKLCAVAERRVLKAKISCQMMVHCLKTIVIVLTKAVEMCAMLEAVVRALDRKGHSAVEFRNAASLASHWTGEALVGAERAIRLHKEASTALQAAGRGLDTMRNHLQDGSRLLRDITVAGDRFLVLAWQSNLTSTQIRIREAIMKRMRRSLMPSISKLRSLRNLTEQWSAMCGDTLSVVLEELSLATQSSCNVIEGATRAVKEFSSGWNLSRRITIKPL